jgi:peroxiredoxin
MIKIGDKLPEATFRVMTADGPKPRTASDVFKGKRVVLIGMPGAFTPTCSMNHLPGYLKQAEAIRAKNVDAIGLGFDGTERGIGPMRSKRYSMLVDDGVVKALNVEAETGKAEVSSADNMIKML